MILEMLSVTTERRLIDTWKRKNWREWNTEPSLWKNDEGWYYKYVV